MNYDEVIQRAEFAASFVQHPYWPMVARMLSGTIQAETESLLASDEHKEINRASVAMCRKVLQMPFFDIEQGKVIVAEFERAKAVESRRRSNRSANAQEEKYSGKH